MKRNMLGNPKLACMKTNGARANKFTTDHLRLLYPEPANEESLYSILTKWSVVISEYGNEPPRSTKPLS